MAGSVWGSALDARIPWVTERQLGYWIDKGYVVPQDRGHRGPGGDRVFSHDEARVLTVMARLVRAGLSAQRSAELARLAFAGSGLSGVAVVPLGDSLEL